MVSAPIVTSGSIQVVAGSTMVTPASISAPFFLSRRCAETTARSRRLLTPRISVGSSSITVPTPSPRRR